MPWAGQGSQPASKGEWGQTAPGCPGLHVAPGALALGVKAFDAVDQMVLGAEVEALGSSRYPAIQSRNSLDSLRGRAGAPLLPRGASWRERWSPACGGIGTLFPVLCPVLGGLTHLGPPGRWKTACPPQDQPRALTTPAVSILQGFTRCSNQGIHGRRDRRLCPLPSSQHRDSALCRVALSKPEDRKTACS